jgi:hypothetical protein
MKSCVAFILILTKMEKKEETHLSWDPKASLTWVDVPLGDPPLLPETVLWHTDAAGQMHTLVAHPGDGFFHVWLQTSGDYTLSPSLLRRRLWNKYYYPDADKAPYGFKARAALYPYVYQAIAEQVEEQGRARYRHRDRPVQDETVGLLFGMKDEAEDQHDDDERDIPANFLPSIDAEREWKEEVKKEEGEEEETPATRACTLFHLQLPNYGVCRFLLQWVAARGKSTGLGHKSDRPGAIQATLAFFYKEKSKEWPARSPLDDYWRIGCTAKWHPGLSWQLGEVTMATRPVAMLFLERADHFSELQRQVHTTDKGLGMKPAEYKQWHETLLNALRLHDPAREVGHVRFAQLEKQVAGLAMMKGMLKGRAPVDRGKKRARDEAELAKVAGLKRQRLDAETGQLVQVKQETIVSLMEAAAVATGTPILHRPHDALLARLRHAFAEALGVSLDSYGPPPIPRPQIKRVGERLPWPLKVLASSKVRLKRRDEASLLFKPASAVATEEGKARIQVLLDQFRTKSWSNPLRIHVGVLPTPASDHSLCLQWIVWSGDARKLVYDKKTGMYE